MDEACPKSITFRWDCTHHPMHPVVLLYSAFTAVLIHTYILYCMQMSGIMLMSGVMRMSEIMLMSGVMQMSGNVWFKAIFYL